MVGSRGLPALALLAALAGAASCGGSKDKDTDTQCADECDAINNCVDVVGRTCKPATDVAACKKALAAGDKVKKAEVACVLGAKCDGMAKCFGGGDPCAGVKCTSPQICRPDTGICDNAQCMFQDQNQPCTGDQFCFKSFCIDAYPRTYRFTYTDVIAPQTDDMNNPWDADGPPDLVAQVWVNSTLVGTSDVVADKYTSSDLNKDAGGTASFDVHVNDAGDQIKVMLLDQDELNATQTIYQCPVDNLPEILRKYTGTTCAPAESGGDPLKPHFTVSIQAK